MSANEMYEAACKAMHEALKAMYAESVSEGTKPVCNVLTITSRFEEFERRASKLM